MKINQEELLSWTWEDLKPYYAELDKIEVTSANIEHWLKDWSNASELGDELYNRLYVATTINTADETAARRFEVYMNETYPNLMIAEQKLKEKLLASGLSFKGMEIPLRNMKAEFELFREENLELKAREEKLNTEHDKVIGAQMVEWQGEQRTARQMEAVLREPDREIRRTSWEQLSSRQLEDREEINSQWVEFMKLRKEMAGNAGKTDFRAYRWQELMRFDYSPKNCQSFHQAIEEIVVPAVDRRMKKRREILAINQVHFYDTFVDLSGKPALSPFNDVRELKDKASGVFHRVLPEFGEYFDIMDQEGLLDLENRKNKAGGGYCTQFAHSKRPFIFANAVGIHDDVQTLLHEGGHSFHTFECFNMQFFHQSAVPMEFAEVASMGMEFLSQPYLDEQKGGYYSVADAARARVDHIEASLTFWPYMAIVDAFQHWVYENYDDGIDPSKCDEKWAELEKRFR
ncbi:MAG: M3 family oligoendopeptidase, partial [Chloroflexi bacterium]|nr:M3 family oligoendopeptidase [Chloroflexota bacterium]